MEEPTLKLIPFGQLLPALGGEEEAMLVAVAVEEADELARGGRVGDEEVHS